MGMSSGYSEAPDSKALRHEAGTILNALRDSDNEFDLRRLLGMMRVARS
jgi:hypothetical protein